MPAPAVIEQRGNAGYTILEICLVLFIVALIVGASIPFTGSLIAEQQMREPVRQIELLARTARHLATLQQRPYVLILNRDHIVLQPYDPTDPLTFFQPPETTSTNSSGTTTLVSSNAGLMTTTYSTPTNSVSTNNFTPTPEGDSPLYTLRDPVTEEYTIPDGVSFKVRGWQEKDWYEPVDRTWIFPVTGLCEPLEIRIERGEGYVEHTYDPLTGAVKSEKFYQP